MKLIKTAEKHYHIILDDSEIEEIVKFLYENYGILITVLYKRHSQNKHFAYNIKQANGIETYLWEHTSESEAYESAIEYTLKNLI